jgi:hypothetical protein
MQGFAPADEVLLFRQKDPKPLLPVRDPPGPSTFTLNQDGSGTRSAQTAFAEEADSVRRRSRTQGSER